MEIKFPLIVTVFFYIVLVIFLIGINEKRREKSVKMFLYGVLATLISVILSKAFGHFSVDNLLLTNIHGPARGITLGYSMIMSGITVFFLDLFKKHEK